MTFLKTRELQIELFIYMTPQLKYMELLPIYTFSLQFFVLNRIVNQEQRLWFQPQLRSLTVCVNIIGPILSIINNIMVLLSSQVFLSNMGKCVKMLIKNYKRKPLPNYNFYQMLQKTYPFQILAVLFFIFLLELKSPKYILICLIIYTIWSKINSFKSDKCKIGQCKIEKILHKYKLHCYISNER